MTPDPTVAQREARLQRNAGCDLANWALERGRFGFFVSRADICAEALRRYPDPVRVEPRVETWRENGEEYRWAGECLERRQPNAPDFPCGKWHEGTWAGTCTAAWLDFANDLRSWPLRVVGSGRVCRQGTDGKLEFRDGESK